VHRLRYSLASFAYVMLQRTSAWTEIDSMPRSGPLSRRYLLAGKESPLTGLNSMRGWRTISHATGVPVYRKETGYGT